jgi:hypothetical protein
MLRKTPPNLSGARKIDNPNLNAWFHWLPAYGSVSSGPASLISVRLCFHPTDVFLFSIIENARAVTASPKAITLQHSGQPGLVANPVAYGSQTGVLIRVCLPPID